MTDNSGWKCVALKTCKNYFIPLFKALRLFIIKKIKTTTTMTTKTKKTKNKQ